MKLLKKKPGLKFITASFVLGGYAWICIIGTIITITIFYQRDYGFMINAAGRQRMLLQKMSRDLFAYAEGMESIKHLQESMDIFESNLKAFLTGGKVSLGKKIKRIDRVKEARLIRSLQRIMDSWISLKGLIYSYKENPDRNKLLKIYQISQITLNEIDNMVGILEESATRRLKNTMLISIALIISYLLGGIIVWFLLDKNITRPTLNLIHGLKIVASGNLQKKINPSGAREMVEALENFNLMTERLRHTLFQLDTIVNGMGEGLYLTDLDRKITFVNPAVEKITGFKPEKLLGKSCEDVFGHSDYKETTLCTKDCGIKRCIDENKLLTGYVFSKTVWGDKIPLYINTSPLRDSNGEVKGAIVTFMDISKQRRLEEEIMNYKIEMSMAKEVYEKLLPQRLPSFKGLRILPKLKPSRELSGDFYDILPLSDHQIGIFIADVIGHGLSAAFMVSGLKMVLSMLRSSLTKPSEFMARASQMLYSILGEDQFITANFALIDTERMVLQYASAGHPHPLIFHGSRLKIQYRSGGGFPLGAFPEVSYDEVEIPIQKGDMILFYTDGIIEASNKEKKEFGIESLCQSFLRAAKEKETLDAIVGSILEDIMGFTGEKSFRDDLLLIIVEVVETRNDFPYVWTIPSSIEIAEGIIKEVYGFLKYKGWEEDDINSAVIALGEAIYNAIEHGNKGDERKKVYVGVSLDIPQEVGSVGIQKLVLVIRDEGEGFDYMKLPDPKIPENILNARGRGVSLMRHLMDEVYFNATGNEVKMVKYKVKK